MLSLWQLLPTPWLQHLLLFIPPFVHLCTEGGQETSWGGWREAGGGLKSWGYHEAVKRGEKLRGVPKEPLGSQCGGSRVVLGPLQPPPCCSGRCWNVPIPLSLPCQPQQAALGAAWAVCRCLGSPPLTSAPNGTSGGLLGASPARADDLSVGQASLELGSPAGFELLRWVGDRGRAEPEKPNFSECSGGVLPEQTLRLLTPPSGSSAGASELC